MNFTLSDKISTTIIVMGLFGLSLVFYSTSSFRTLAYEHHRQAIQSLAQLEVNEHIDTLKKNATDLALSIESEPGFSHDTRYKDTEKLSNLLNNQFYQYFVTAGVLKLLKLSILDADFTLLSQSSEGLPVDKNTGVICPKLSQAAQQRQGSEKLQILAKICTHNNHPVYAVIVPFGGLRPKGYILIITDLAYALQSIEKKLAMPIQLFSPGEDLLFKSKNWPETTKKNTYINVDLPVIADEVTVLILSLHVNMIEFNQQINHHRNLILTLTSAVMVIAVICALLIFRHSQVHPLSRLLEVVDKIHSNPFHDGVTGKLLFVQLLEQIILLRKKNQQGFAVMILDLTKLKKINVRYGRDVGNQLLTDVESRLGNILRESDKISWVGTDTPGHKLRESDAKTFYRATLARLGGDEFGLLLPSAKNACQIKAIAERIITELEKEYEIGPHKISVHCKIGISLFPEHGSDENTLIRHADKAMYQAKEKSLPFFIYQNEDV